MDEPLKGSKDHHRASDVQEKKYSMKNYLRFGHIHGLKYLGRKEKTEICFWLTVLLISISFAAYFIVALNCSNTHSTIKVNLPLKPVHHLPFPAITICPEIKSKKDIADFTEAYLHYQSDNQTKTLSDVETSQIEALSQVCDPHLLQNIKLQSNPTPGKDFEKILKNISKPFTLFCQFRGTLEDCTKHFNEKLTDDGLCYTLNMLEASDMFKNDGESSAPWNVRSGYASEEFDVYPRRAFAGADVGFNVVLKSNEDDLDYICKGPVQGYKVLIHSPDELPRMAKGFVRVPLNSETIVATNPEVSLSNGGACYSSSSKSLKYFKQYSHANCITECISSYTLKQCGCVKFTMVHDDNTKICSQHETKCVADVPKNFSTSYAFESKCDCKPSCDTLNYNTKVSQAVFDFKKTFEAFGADLESEFPGARLSRLMVYVGNDYYTTTMEKAQNSIYETVAKIGGILAFFLGASLISLVEVLFYFIRRFTC